MKYRIRRQFKLMGKPYDLQYVSRINDDNSIAGYDKSVKHALQFSELELKHILDELNFIRAVYEIEEVM